MHTFRTILPDRGVLRVGGPEAVAFLQGLVSNDVAKAAPGRAVYAALLTAQGRYLHDFIIVRDGDDLLLDCEAARRDDLFMRLKRFRLRSKVTLEDATDALAVAVAVGGSIPGGFADPRLPGLGTRAILPRATAEAALAATGLPEGTPADWDAHRMALGVPDGSRDLPVEKALLLESGFEELNGVDFTKGCYVGQELTARTKYRGLVKKRLMPVRIEGAAPPPGTPVTAEGRDAGETRSVSGDRGLALVRLDALHAPALSAGEATLTPEPAAWMRLPAPGGH